MRLADLALLYAAAGVACAVAIYRAEGGSRPRALAAAALAIPLWPLWAPIALTSARRAPGGAWAPAGDGGAGRRPGRAGARGAGPDPAARLEAALQEGVEACAGTALEALLSKGAAARIAAEVARAAARRDEIDALLARDGFDLRAAERRVADLERERASPPASGARPPGPLDDRAPAPSPRALTTARLHLENVRRLHALRDRDERALEELSDLVQALRTQLVLARFAGSSIEGASGIVSEVWARVEGLGAVMEAQDGGHGDLPPPAPSAAAAP